MQHNSLEIMASADTQAEVEGMRRAGRLAASVLEMIGEHVRPGVTTGELDRLCHHYITEEIDCIPAPLGYTAGGSRPPFPGAICTSVNHVVCHGVPSDRKVLKDGDTLNIDVTVIKDGYHGDTSKMFTVGKGSVLSDRLVRVTQECMYLGIREVAPGKRLGDIGHAIQQHAKSERFSVVREYCGHGIGKVFHAPPQVVHYGRPGTGVEIQAGMTFTIEPMINVGRPETKEMPDQWTVITRDRKLTAQWEHTILVTDSGYEILTWREEESIPRCG